MCLIIYRNDHIHMYIYIYVYTSFDVCVCVCVHVGARAEGDWFGVFPLTSQSFTQTLSGSLLWSRKLNDSFLLWLGFGGQSPNHP